MLSKSQAKWFFLLATGGFSGVFLWFTVDTMAQLPERSHEDQLTDAVIRGKTTWDENNCMGCHTLLGEGAYYAPELTKVIERRGATWIRTFIKDPEAMYPGRRKMVKYDFSEEEIDDLISFFTWIGNVDTNGFPAEPDLAPPPVAVAPAASSGPPPPSIFSTICVSCHSLGGAGGKVGPALDGVSQRYDKAELRAWLSDPQSVKPGTAMPNLQLSSDDLDALTTFLMTK